MPAIDDFKTFTPGLTCPVTHAITITPDNATDLPHLTRAIYVGGAGNVRVTMADGSVVTFGAMSTGWQPIRIARVHATGTTATSIIGAW